MSRFGKHTTIVLAFWLFMQFPTLQAQVSPDSSLTSKSEEKVLANLISEGRDNVVKNPDKALDNGLQALVLAKKLGDTRFEIEALLILAESNFTLGQYENSSRYYNRALNFYDQLGNSDAKYKILIGLGRVYDAEKNPELAISTLERGLASDENINNINLYIDLLELLGELYQKQGNYRKSAEMYSKVLAIVDNPMGRKVLLKEKIKSDAFFKLGQVKKNSGELVESLSNFKQAAEISINNFDSLSYSNALQEIALTYYLLQKPDSANFYFTASYAISNKISDTVGMIQGLQGIADIYLDSGNPTQALYYYNQQLTVAQKLKNIPAITESLVKISRCYLSSGDISNASKYLNRALAIARQNNLTQSVADVYQYLAILNEGQGRYRDALEFYKMWVETRDSIYFEETGQKLAKLKILYEISQKEKENELLRQNSEIQNLQLNKTRYQTRILILIIIIFITLIVLLIILFRSKQKEIAKRLETEQRITDLNRELERRMIQEIKKQEKQQLLLAQKSKLESLGTLAAGIAHEINQPLGGISMGLDNILLKVQDKSYNDEYMKEKIASLFENVERIKKIIDHIRYFSRAQKPVTFTQININDVVNSSLFMVSTQYENHGVKMEVTLDENIGSITADKYKLEQVILNLLSNAKYAVDEKGKKHANHQYTKLIEIKTWQDNNQVYLSVRDNGMGIPDKIIDKIFDPFFTTKSEERGTGLGLSVSYAFIKDLLGDIKVESVEGEYTRFEISLPKM